MSKKFGIQNLSSVWHIAILSDWPAVTFVCRSTENRLCIHPKSKKLFGFCFSVQKNLRKKWVNRSDKVLRQKCINYENCVKGHFCVSSTGQCKLHTFCVLRQFLEENPIFFAGTRFLDLWTQLDVVEQHLACNWKPAFSIKFSAKQSQCQLGVSVMIPRRMETITQEGEGEVTATYQKLPGLVSTLSPQHLPIFNTTTQKFFWHWDFSGTFWFKETRGWVPFDSCDLLTF